MTQFIRYFSIIAGTALFAMTASAQTQHPEKTPDQAAKDTPKRAMTLEGWNVFVGAGTLVMPNYSGDDDYRLMAVPFVRVSHGTKFFASVPEGIGYAVIEKGGLKAGPLAVLNFGRGNKGNSPFRVGGKKTTDLIGLGKIDPTLQLGGFFEYDFGDIEITARGGQAVSGHDGAIAKFGMAYETRIATPGPPLFFKAGPNIRIADDNFMQSFYGITPAQSAASGLPAYDADSGVVSYGFTANLLVPVSYTAGFGFFGGYEHLTGNAAKSPLIQQRGREDQLIGGIAFARKF
ncbi:MAG: MipA/OmpV family protein [Hellea sp.]|nr:MipA/OmpV family protein [Hellea sp.]